MNKLVIHNSKAWDKKSKQAMNGRLRLILIRLVKQKGNWSIRMTPEKMCRRIGFRP